MWLDTRGREFARRAIGGRSRATTAKILPSCESPGRTLTLRRRPDWTDPVSDEPRAPDHERDALDDGPVDYLTMRFTGVASATHASRLASWLTDNRVLTRYEYDEQLLKIVGIDPRTLPPLQPIGSAVATVAPRWPKTSGSPPTPL